MKINFNSEEQFALSTKESFTPPYNGYINSAVSFDGDLEAQLAKSAVVSTYSVFNNPVKTQKEDGFSIKYDLWKSGVTLTEKVKTFEGIDAIEQYTEVTNNSVDEVSLTQLCASTVLNVCYDGGNSISKRLIDGSIKVHYCVAKWQTEGQWREATPEDLGVFNGTTHGWEMVRWRLDSISTWSTGSYYPILIIEDEKKGECWFFESLSGFNWFIELFTYGGEKDCHSLCVKIGGFDERNGFNEKLSNGRVICSPKCVYGVTEGCFEDACKELIKYKRQTALVKKPSPLVFNDYMNCNWGLQSTKRLIPLIDKASDIGAEIFCLDDGWHTGFGFWEPCDQRFSDLGVKGIIDHINSKGMKAGVWFELESISEKLESVLGNDVYLKRNGKRVAPYRPIADMRNQKLRSHLFNCIKKMYDLGVRYIKNDHNNTSGIGIDNFNESVGYSLYQNHLAFLSFIDSVKESFPDLIIENCGSGGMREDFGTLSHFDIQSTSDQENYLYYTSILSGSLAYIPAEKAGIWAYPYPQSFDERELEAPSIDNLKSFEDGIQTVYNVVNALAGNMYLSGRVDLMNEVNLKFLKDGINVYKCIREKLAKSYPVYPLGRIRTSYEGIYAFGNMCDDELLLYVWNISDCSAYKSIDLVKYKMEKFEIIYPLEDIGIKASFKNNKLEIRFDKPYSAVLIKFSK